ncbi:response regulator [Chitinispirillales bacterium ANBcel5]|uniref:response regulator n=1 Tax=Cellulosispirillum alkaliphilum TaxID=3039283 RepID=UPI002A4F4107|nr:response regulator [Chitinispirillales bacterium ANBcel5]
MLIPLKQSTTTAKVSTVRKRKRLLVIDDDPAVLFAMRKIFKEANILIDTCQSFEEAKQLISNNHYHVILTDLCFSDEITDAGVKISDYAKKKIPGVIVILWTGNDNPSFLKDQSRSFSIDFVFAKPLSPGVIKSILENLIFV